MLTLRQLGGGEGGFAHHLVRFPAVVGQLDEVADEGAAEADQAHGGVEQPDVDAEGGEAVRAQLERNAPPPHVGGRPRRQLAEDAHRRELGDDAGHRARADGEHRGELAAGLGSPGGQRAHESRGVTAAHVVCPHGTASPAQKPDKFSSPQISCP
jgi:hypothetical protein